jgi:DnaA family protein
MQQLPLGVRIPDRAVFESFLPAKNLQAVEHAKRVAEGSVTGVTWICGPAGVGKSHLLQAVCARAGGRAGYFPLTELAPLGVGVLEGLATSLDVVCIDDLDRVVGELEWEHALFGVFRETAEKDGRLVVSAKAPPALLPWKLPDLGSRFTAAAIFQLRELDESEQQSVLQLRARVRGFELPDDTSRWLQRRFPRDMRTLYELLDTLDEAALIAQRRLTIPFIRSVLKE